MPKEKMLRKCEQKFWNIPLNYSGNQVKPASAPPSSLYLPAIPTDPPRLVGNPGSLWCKSLLKHGSI